MYVTLFLVGVVVGIFLNKYWPQEKAAIVAQADKVEADVKAKL